MPNLAQVFDVYKEILESKGFLQQNGIVQPEEAALFINAVSASSLAYSSPFSLVAVSYNFGARLLLSSASATRACPTSILTSCSMSRLPIHGWLQDCSSVLFSERLLACSRASICNARTVLSCSAVMSS